MARYIAALYRAIVRVMEHLPTGLYNVHHLYPSISGKIRTYMGKTKLSLCTYKLKPGLWQHWQRSLLGWSVFDWTLIFFDYIPIIINIEQCGLGCTHTQSLWIVYLLDFGHLQRRKKDTLPDSRTTSDISYHTHTV